MAIQQWHWGKLVLSWLAAIVGSVWFYVLANGPKPQDGPEAILAGIILLGLLMLPIFAFVVTWKWLSAKEGRTEK